MGILGWLTGQGRQPVVTARDENPADVAANDASPVEFPEFRLVSVPGLQDELDRFVSECQTPEELAFGRMLSRALVGDEIEPPAMPDDVLRIQKLLASPDCDVPPLATAIGRDPTIAGRFVAIANCSLYARADRAKTVADAVVRIGMKQTSMIVMAIVSKTKLFRVPGLEEEARLLHRHCLAAGVSSQMVARRARIPDGDAFMGGLLHDIGRIWLMSVWASLLRESRGKTRLSEASLARFSERLHAGLSALIVENWGFDERMVGAILCHQVGEHHQDTIERLCEQDRSLAWAIAAGNLISIAMLNPNKPRPEALDVLSSHLGVPLDSKLQAECLDGFVQFEQLLA